MTRGGFDLLMVGTLFIVPLMSMLVGRLQSLCIDFVGSAVSLVFSFFITIGQYLNDKPTKGRPEDYIDAVIYVVGLTGLTAGLCIWLHRSTQELRRKQKLEDGYIGDFLTECLYWVATIAAMALVIFSFILNTGYKTLFDDKTVDADPLASFFSSLVEQKPLRPVVIYSFVALLLCALLRYVPAARRRRRA